MGTITKNNTFSTGATILAAEHNENYDTIYNEFNGSIDDANIKATANIASSKLATITSAGKVSGASLTLLGDTPSGGGQLPVANGGTAGATAAAARGNLGIADLATQSASGVAITGGSVTGITDLAVADGGTGKGTKLINYVTYTGGGNDDRDVAHGMSATPQYIYINNASEISISPVVWMSGMTAGYSRKVDGALLVDDCVKSVNGTNTSLGTDQAVNKDGVTYCMLVIQGQ